MNIFSRTGVIQQVLVITIALALVQGCAGNGDMADDVNTWENQVTALMKMGKYTEALGAVDIALETEPYDYALDDKGYILYVLGRYDESEQVFEEQISFSPDDSDAWYGKGMVQLEQDRYKEALASFSQAVNLDPEFSDAWVGMGESLIGMKNDREALEPFHQAVTMDPNNPDAWFYQGIALSNLGRKDEAVRSFNKVLEIDPEYDEAATLIDIVGGKTSLMESFYTQALDESGVK